MTAPIGIEALLGELRCCHEPTQADRERVREALGEAVVRERLAKPAEADGGVRRVAHLKLLLGSGSSTMVGVMTLAAAAAAAVVTLAAPGIRNGALLGSATGAIELEPEPWRPKVARDEPSAPEVRAFSRSERGFSDVDEVGGCSAWPCLEPEPRRALVLGGAEVSEPRKRSTRPVASPVDDAPVPEGKGASKPERRPPVEVTPALALDIAPGRVTPGAALRLAVPVTESRRLALEATLQRFPVEGADGLWVGGMGVCWRPVQGRLEASLCGAMGYESGSTEARREPARGGSPWRLTAGGSAEAVYNISEELALYVAVQGAVPVAASVGAERAAGVRVMAGPRLSF